MLSERSGIQFTLQKEVNGGTNSFTLCFLVGETETEDVLDFLLYPTYFKIIGDI